MSGDNIPEDVRQFIDDEIQSVEQLEVLLLLYEESHQEWNATTVSQKLAIHPESAALRLADLENRTLLTSRTDGSGMQTYRFNPQIPALSATVSRLADTYKNMRVTVITLIFSKPVDYIRSFADAFKFRKDE